jgi:hypothetical protein
LFGIQSVDAFDNALEAVVKESGLRLKKLDKKAERALLFAYRKGLASQVEDETDPVALLPKVVALLFVQVNLDIFCNVSQIGFSVMAPSVYCHMRTRATSV